MELLSGKDAAEHVAGILHPKYQVHGSSVHLTVRKIYAIDSAGKLDFGGSEYAPAGRVEVAPHPLRAEDKYLWWDLDRQSYFVVCNETLRLAPMPSMPQCAWSGRNFGLTSRRPATLRAAPGNIATN